MNGDVTITYRNDYGYDQRVVLFFENPAMPATPPIAWRVVEHAGFRAWHVAVLPSESTLIAEVPLTDVPALTLPGGGLFELQPTINGAALVQTSAGAPDTFAVTGRLPIKAASLVDVTLHKGGPLMRATIPLEPDAIAAFVVKPVVVFATTTANVQAGDALDAATLSSVTPFVFANLNATTIALTRNGDGAPRFVRVAP